MCILRILALVGQLNEVGRRPSVVEHVRLRKKLSSQCKREQAPPRRSHCLIHHKYLPHDRGSNYMLQNRSNSPPKSETTSRWISARVGCQPVSARSWYFSTNTLAISRREWIHL